MDNLLRSEADNGDLVVAADLEGTLTVGSTWHGMRDYLIEHGGERAYRNFFLRRLPGIIRFRLGMGDTQAFKYGWIRDMWMLYRGYPAAEIEAVARWIVEQELWPSRRATVLEELVAYDRRGHRIVIASGVAEPILEAFLDKMEAEEGLICEGMGTPLLLEPARGDEATFTGRFATEINIGTRKAARLAPFARDGQIEAAYGDTAPDEAMLALSRQPVAVAPDDGLRRVAEARGWRIIEAGPHG